MLTYWLIVAALIAALTCTTAGLLVAQAGGLKRTTAAFTWASYAIIAAMFLFAIWAAPIAATM